MVYKKKKTVQYLSRYIFVLSCFLSLLNVKTETYNLTRDEILKFNASELTKTLDGNPDRDNADMTTTQRGQVFSPEDVDRLNDRQQYTFKADA